jgi:uncharacterized protein (TIGR04255 family)
MLDNLHPILGGHSVSRSTVSLYLPQEVIKPEQLFDRIYKHGYFSTKYQKRNKIYSRTINIKNDKNALSITDEMVNDNIVGFVFEEFNSDGEVENILTLQNDNNRTLISFETRKYIRWDNFFNRFLEDFTKLTNEHQFYFEALSLTYIDEFIWKSEEKIPVEEIFEKKSELINSKFLKSNNGTIVLFSQNEDDNVEEKTEISFNNGLKRIQIIHQHATKFNNLSDSNTLIENNNIKNLLNIAHISNKDTLKDLLTQTVKEKINLN